ncbi:MbtH family protein [Rhizobium rhizogenes]|uniref:MbtH family protein n=1 Tax=Rhizobium rhizogenes TaxID=359 RepID=UPI001573C575|nr:MbtH family protein [Rhizobium rhizogenes]NTG65178.1 MbtH family protein [Rhizobium rhizogenes]NTH68917.1 MbtH family protein [Rhizobium rhizogenes]NTI00379.1 MbtH family protein [Rhizobium rhizogenes]NTI39754.1 MbtH family protein [Rhizobium rhizogenes]NTJ18619.1 MbtH family protein [Rhizobium rhizogenes]
MANPFENGTTFIVLNNNENQYSLWPDSIAVPAGWNTVFGPAEKSLCLDFINENWKDMRPNSLVEKMENLLH